MDSTTFTLTETCYPRIGILGNPSDGYGGRVLAACFRDFEATVSLTIARDAAEGWRVEGTTFQDYDALRSCTGQLDGIADLLASALVAWQEAASTPPTPTRVAIDARTTIPRQVGLSGSSAILVAALRSLAAATSTVLDVQDLARLALHAEREILGIEAGPQDRLIQSHGACALLDFATHEWRLEALDPGLLPDLLLVWQALPGTPSGDAHRALRARFDAGDPNVHASMLRFAQLADAGRDAMQQLEGSERAQRFASLVDEAWQLRLACYPTTDEDRRVADEARAQGLSATLAGSGGALVLAPRDGDSERFDAFLPRADELGYRGVRPRFVPVDPQT